MCLASSFDNHFRASSAGATALTDAISGNGALTKFDISDNSLKAEGGKALAVGLKGNHVMTALNIAGNRLTMNAGGNAYDDMSGVAAVADAIKDMGALSQFTFSGDNYDSKPVTMEISMTEADFSAKGLGDSGAILVAAFLPKCT
jgi:hypothetical protein